MAFTTAIEAWDKRWATAEGRADWLDPEPEVIALLPELKARGARTALISAAASAATRSISPSMGSPSRRSTAVRPASRSCARRHGPAAYPSAYARERPMRCRSTVAASISRCRGT
jgi:hypothetical protein